MTDLEKALLEDASPLSLLALAHIENQNDRLKHLLERIVTTADSLELLADKFVDAKRVPNKECIIALEEAGMREAAAIIRRLK